MKFRAWNGKYMILPDLSDWDDFFILPDGDIGFMDEDSSSYSGYRFLGYRTDWEVMQFTGLLDKNGKEIYEGDIVKFFTYYYKKGTSRIVAWDDCGRWLPFCDDDYIQDEQGDHFNFDKGFEILGNIYENPELLKS